VGSNALAELVAPDGEGCHESPPAPVVTNGGDDDVLVFHVHNHALSKAVGEEESQGVETDSLDGKDEGGGVGAETQRLDNEANIGHGGLNLLILGGRQPHLGSALVIDPVADLGDWAFVWDTRQVGRPYQGHPVFG
jgi:hypothetical protein